MIFQAIRANHYIKTNHVSKVKAILKTLYSTMSRFKDIRSLSNKYYVDRRISLLLFNFEENMLKIVNSIDSLDTIMREILAKKAATKKFTTNNEILVENKLKTPMIMPFMPIIPVTPSIRMHSPFHRDDLTPHESHLYINKSFTSNDIKEMLSLVKNESVLNKVKQANSKLQCIHTSVADITKRINMLRQVVYVLPVYNTQINVSIVNQINK